MWIWIGIFQQPFQFFIFAFVFRSSQSKPSQSLKYSKVLKFLVRKNSSKMAEAEEFSPKVYSFVLSPEFGESLMCWELDSYEVASPGFAVLLDHTLAVIWHAFHIDGAELYTLNKADLCWALRFLEAIDTSQAGDTTDLDALIDFLRKTLVTRNSMDDEKLFVENNKTMYDSIADSGFSTSLALDEFLNSAEVKQDMRLEAMRPKTNVETKCTEAQILEHLKKLNPLIQALDDVKLMTKPE